jgi:hypothetical protein
LTAVVAAIADTRDHHSASYRSTTAPQLLAWIAAALLLQVAAGVRVDAVAEVERTGSGRKHGGAGRETRCRVERLA